MYLPRHFAEPRLEVLHELIRARPLATLVTHGADGLTANHIPLHLFDGPTPAGTLRGHVARANPLGSAAFDGVATLAIFHGPDIYISPGWYATKKETGKVVPTWNYAVAHVHGHLRVIDDPAYLRGLLPTLTDHHEAASAHPWAMTDAPEDYITQMIGNIVGIELPIERLVGKWKVSQNQPERNRASLAEGLAGRDGDDAAAMAALVRSRQ
jgi:transcriptional regulator